MVDIFRLGDWCCKALVMYLRNEGSCHRKNGDGDWSSLAYCWKTTRGRLSLYWGRGTWVNKISPNAREFLLRWCQFQIHYAVKEYACTAVDVLARRTRLAFLSTQAAEEALPTIIKILQKRLGWSSQRAKSEHEEALQFIYHEMGKKVRFS